MTPGSVSNDRPDLNKCPDCGCYFSQDDCPLCGKPCPDEMRAGNRKAVRQKKKKTGTSDRVIFINWYHRWWFIILMLFFSPIIGIILLATSPHKKSRKVLVIVLAVAYTIFVTYGLGGMLIGGITELFNRPVDTSLDRDEYIAKCETVDAEDFYRDAESYDGKFVTMTLSVKYKFVDVDAYSEKYATYYVCSGEGGEYTILMRDCLQDGKRNFIPGDSLTVYGEGAGSIEVYDYDYEAHGGPCINVAYATVNN